MMAWNLLQDRARRARRSTARSRSSVEKPRARRRRGVGIVLVGRPRGSHWSRSASVSPASAFVQPTGARCVIVGLVACSVSSACDPPCVDRLGEAGGPRGTRCSKAAPLLFTVLTLIAVLIGGVAELLPTRWSCKRRRRTPRTRQKPYTRARARGPRHLRPRGLLHLPLADDPAACARDAALRRLLEARRTPSTTTRSSGAASAPARTSRAMGGKYPNLWHYAHMHGPARHQPRLEHAPLQVAGRADRSTPSSRARSWR